jgi:hypothetical protein
MEYSDSVEDRGYEEYCIQAEYSVVQEVEESVTDSVEDKGYEEYCILSEFSVVQEIESVTDSVDNTPV